MRLGPRDSPAWVVGLDEFCSCCCRGLIHRPLYPGGYRLCQEGCELLGIGLVVEAVFEPLAC
jgi:hypothetical protein